MKKRFFLQKTATAGLAILTGCILLANGIITEKAAAIKKIPGIELRTDERIYKLVKIKDIKNALDKSTNKKMILNIYPVKLSKDPKKKDIELQVIFQDKEDLKKSLGNKINNKLFTNQSTWYIGYLKSTGVSSVKVPYGYYLEIDPGMLENVAGISFYLSADKSEMEYYLLGEQDTPAEAKKPDSTCKCPPECCDKLVVLSHDSTGKCPPECLQANIFFGNTMKRLITNVYKK